MADGMIIVIFSCIVALSLSPAALLVFGAVKRRKKLVIGCSVVLASEILLVTAYNILFPTCFPYVDLWIKGKTEAEIISVYGEYDIKHGGRIGYELTKSFLSSGPEYYYIHFDKNGIADLVEKSGPIGG